MAITVPQERLLTSRTTLRRNNAAEYLFLVPAVLFVGFTVLYPLAYNVVQSFQDVGIAQIVSGQAKYVGLDNYADQFGRPEFWESFGISLVYTGGTVLVTFVAGLALALFFHRDFPGRNVLRALLLLAWVLPTVVSANVWRWLLDGTYGLLNTVLGTEIFWLGAPSTAMIAVVLASAWSFAPFAMILLLAGLQGISGSLYEAARIDGAGAWAQFRRITLPLLKPVSLTTVLLCFISTFKTFDTVFLMTQGGPGGATEVLPVYAYKLAFSFYKFDVAAVATTMLLVVPVVLSVFYFRSLRKEELA
ncbi:binding-protein-dependent transport systems inner membrane component [Kribbella flavida DSM 17836]|uniref:Binding-protein-dependent transport systems inner membrane component n=1 Tax=Kribbella flavida (strain DSM 17836 / JCM 10339 / NBRC 14399) TaxID=479435 RepID=D2PRS2_KRIFD|nr:sugar ABC transporter permease [Kribbella flavida]ADB29252.1 binding-protein-dependent transport systems inner membrane component [Kribbella flavida DSM 17836]